MANASSVRTNAAASRRGSETRCRWGRSDVAMRRWRLFRNRTVVTMSAAGAPPVHSWTNANCEAPAKMSRLIAAISIGASPAWRATTPKVVPTIMVVPRTGQPSGSAPRAVDRPAMVLTRLGDATSPVPVRSGAFEPDRSLALALAQHDRRGVAQTDAPGTERGPRIARRSSGRHGRRGGERIALVGRRLSLGHQTRELAFDELGVEPLALGTTKQGSQEGKVGAHTEDLGRGKGTGELPERGPRVAAVRDDLREERGVVVRHHVTLLIPRVDPHAIGPMNMEKPAGRGNDPGCGVLRVDAGLEGVAARP